MLYCSPISYVSGENVLEVRGELQKDFMLDPLKVNYFFASPKIAFKLYQAPNSYRPIWKFHIMLTSHKGQVEISAGKNRDDLIIYDKVSFFVMSDNFVTSNENVKNSI